MKLLTDADILEFARKIEMASFSKQLQPAEVPFDYEQWSNGGWQAYLTGIAVTGLVPGAKYTMRKI